MSRKSVIGFATDTRKIRMFEARHRALRQQLLLKQQASMESDALWMHWLWIRTPNHDSRLQ
jgi:RNAse (barnase) inhibitor barstar